LLACCFGNFYHNDLLELEYDQRDSTIDLIDNFVLMLITGIHFVNGKYHLPPLPVYAYVQSFEI